VRNATDRGQKWIDDDDDDDNNNNNNNSVLTCARKLVAKPALALHLPYDQKNEK